MQNRQWTLKPCLQNIPYLYTYDAGPMVIAHDIWRWVRSELHLRNYNPTTALQAKYTGSGLCSTHEIFPAIAKSHCLLIPTTAPIIGFHAWAFFRQLRTSNHLYRRKETSDIYHPPKISTYMTLHAYVRQPSPVESLINYIFFPAQKLSFIPVKPDGHPVK